MEVDLKIRGARIADGSGGPLYLGDIAIRDGRIVEIGHVSAKAERVLDAEGAVVTPGFIDPHTHYDGQATWDAELIGSSLHGVTTAVMGNCGVGFAPVLRGDQQRLVNLMQGVEDIPGSVLDEGLQWNWQSFSEYLDALDATPRTIDLCAQVTHDPVRLMVMGDRAANREPATAADIEQMRTVVRQALSAGAIGFSTGRTDGHRTADGQDTPASIATREELQGLAAVVGEFQKKVLMVVSDFDMAKGRAAFDREFDLLRVMAESARRPMSLSLMQRFGDPQQWRRIITGAEELARQGHDFRLQVAPRGIGVLMGFSITFNPFIAHPSYRAVANLPLAERVTHLRQPEVKRRLLSESPQKLSGQGSGVNPLVDVLLPAIESLSSRIYECGATFDCEPSSEQSIAAKAQAAGVSALEAMYEALLADEGKALVYFPVFNYAEGHLGVVHEMLTHPQALLGLGDAGAHVATICDSSAPTTLLSHWTKRKSGSISLEKAVHMLTGAQASHFSMDDRGYIRPGLRADLNIIDIDRLSLGKPRVVNDLPAGGSRLIQDAKGYLATLVCGQVIAENGVLTGARPGRLARF